jgi:hypothetical protein
MRHCGCPDPEAISNIVSITDDVYQRYPWGLPLHWLMIVGE